MALCYNLFIVAETMATTVAASGNNISGHSNLIDSDFSRADEQNEHEILRNVHSIHLSSPKDWCSQDIDKYEQLLLNDFPICVTQNCSQLQLLMKSVLIPSGYRTLHN